MRLSAIHIKNAKKQSTACASARLEQGRGLVGDACSAREDRQLSLLDAALLPGLRQLDGLCVKRFDANLLTDGLDYARLAAGQRLRIGGASVELSAVGKRCFDDCAMRMRGERCPLYKGCAFGRVLISGDIAVGDTIQIEE